MIRFFRTYWSQVICLIAGFLLGFFIFTFRYHPKFEEKINPVALASLVLTILLAIYLEFGVRPTLSSNRVEKDLLIGFLKDLLEVVKGLNDKFIEARIKDQLSDEEKEQIISDFRTYSVGITNVTSSLTYCKLSPSVDVAAKIKKGYFKYKAAITGADFAAGRYDRINFAAGEKAYKLALKSITEAIIDINKA